MPVDRRGVASMAGIVGADTAATAEAASPSAAECRRLVRAALLAVRDVPNRSARTDEKKRRDSSRIISAAKESVVAPRRAAPPRFELTGETKTAARASRQAPAAIRELLQFADNYEPRLPVAVLISTSRVESSRVESLDSL